MPNDDDIRAPAASDPPSAESVALLVDRTRQGLPDFQVTHENLESLVEICTQLDGLPLALEAMAAVCMAPSRGVQASIEAVDILTSLVDKSLVQRTRRDTGKPRFHLIETVRHFALEHLDAAGEHDDLASFSLPTPP